MGQWFCSCCGAKDESIGSGQCELKVIPDEDGAVRFIWLKIDVQQYQYQKQGCCWKTLTHREFKLTQHISIYEIEQLRYYSQILHSLPTRIQGRKEALSTLNVLLGT